MDLKEAKEKLDHVISIGRVEMYKPIQIAEVLYRLRTVGQLEPLDKESYRVSSRHWRDSVTLELMGKVSTSSARFQDDIWNESALPPAALEALSNANRENGEVEVYIYSHIGDKINKVIGARSLLEQGASFNNVKELLDRFNSPGLTTSADRIFEIFGLAILETELRLCKATISIQVDSASLIKTESASKMLDLVVDYPESLTIQRLGHTNAADAGLDMWTNFGVSVSVKRRFVDLALLQQVLFETPFERVFIVCLDYDVWGTQEFLSERRNSGQRVSFLTLKDMYSSVRGFGADKVIADRFHAAFLRVFDREFPLALTLKGFLSRRNYDSIQLTGMWRDSDAE